MASTTSSAIRSLMRTTIAALTPAAAQRLAALDQDTGK